MNPDRINIMNGFAKIIKEEINKKDTSKVISIICTKGEKTRSGNNKTAGNYEVIDKEMLIKRIEEITDEGFGYTILIAKKGD